MSVLWTDDALNDMADGSWTLPDSVAVFTADPGPAGDSNEVTGGSYARQSLSWSAANTDGPLGASLQPATVGRVYEAPLFTLPADVEAPWIGYFSGATFRGRQQWPATAPAGSFQPNLALGK